MQRICDKAVRDDSSSLEFVPDGFFTREGLYVWHEDYFDHDAGHWDDDDEDNFFDWYESYKKLKAQKAKIKKRVNACYLAPIKILGLVHVRRRKKKKKKKNGNIMRINIGLFVSDDQMQKYSDPKRITK